MSYDALRQCVAVTATALLAITLESALSLLLQEARANKHDKLTSEIATFIMLVFFHP